METKKSISELIEKVGDEKNVILVTDGMEDQHQKMLDVVSSNSKLLKDQIAIVGCGAMSEVLVREVMALQTNKQIVVAVSNINEFPLTSTRPRGKSLEEIAQENVHEMIMKISPMEHFPDMDSVLAESKKEYGVSKNKVLPIKNTNPKGFVGRKITLRGKHR